MTAATITATITASLTTTTGRTCFPRIITDAERYRGFMLPSIVHKQDAYATPGIIGWKLMPRAAVPEGRHGLALADPTELEERRRGAQGKEKTPHRKKHCKRDNGK